MGASRIVPAAEAAGLGHLALGLERWIDHGIEPGSFLMAVIENDLRRACENADIGNRAQLFEIVSLLYNHAPAGCWGSPERARAWVERKEFEARNRPARTEQERESGRRRGE